jgi:Peptidase M15
VETANVIDPFKSRAIARAKSPMSSTSMLKTPSRFVAPIAPVVVAIAAAAMVSAAPIRAEGADQFHVDVLKGRSAEIAAPTPPLASKMTRGRSNLGADLGEPDEAKNLTGANNITWVANSGCLHPQLKAVVAEIAANYGAVTVNSTCRSPGHNAAIGGAEHSYHLSGNAVDFRVHGNVAGAAAFLNGRVGGYKHSGGGLFHIDTGPRRAMH